MTTSGFDFVAPDIYIRETTLDGRRCRVATVRIYKSVDIEFTVARVKVALQNYPKRIAKIEVVLDDNAT